MVLQSQKDKVTQKGLGSSQGWNLGDHMADGLNEEEKGRLGGVLQ